MNTLKIIWDAIPGPVLVILYVWGICYLLREPIESFCDFKSRQWSEEMDREERAKKLEKLEQENRIKELQSR